MVNREKKKGAVEMSLNLIIMLVIGLTVLGLLIAFVTGFLTDAENTFGGKLTEDDEVQLERILNAEGNLAVSPTSVIVPKGNKNAVKVYVKVRNPTNIDFNYVPTLGEITNLQVGATPSPNNFYVQIAKGKVDDQAATGVPQVYGPPISLTKGETEALPLELYVDETVSTGTYYAKFILSLDSNTKYEKQITVIVE